VETCISPWHHGYLWSSHKPVRRLLLSPSTWWLCLVGGLGGVRGLSHCGLILCLYALSHLVYVYSISPVPQWDSLCTKTEESTS
jgi:hypothetical protein